jgi:nucleoside-diphosphate-sugar epimerase
MFGPALGHHVSGSFGILKNILNGSMVRIPNINLNVIDVRDAAALHVRALQSPNAPGSRFIASADGSISMPQIADLIRRERPERAAAVSQKRLPNTLVTLASPFSEEAREAHLMLSLSRKVSTQRAQDLLGWTPKHTNEEAVLSAVDSLRM